VEQPQLGQAFIFNRPFGPQCLFACPRGKGTCGVECRPTPGDGPRWDNHGTDEAPTLTPSINCGSCGWHGYVQKGHTIDAPDGLVIQAICQKCDEPEIVVFSDGRPVLLTSDRKFVFEHACHFCHNHSVIIAEVPPAVFERLVGFEQTAAVS
jgi:hypothetical protein